jgi:pimeloyl-ACP methyl ester carboxylesterase
VPGSLESLDDSDREAYTHLPHDPERAAKGFEVGFRDLAALLRAGDDSGVLTAFDSVMSLRDKEIANDDVVGPGLVASMREGLSASLQGAAWDNVAWIGQWDIDLDAIRCPVLLWYGEDDGFAPPANGTWLDENLRDATLVLRPAEGHFGLIDHYGEVLDALVALS